MQEQQSLFYLNNVLKNYKLNQADVASVMFPTNKNADLALRRILKGAGHVSVDQLEALAQYVGVSVSAIYEAGCDLWHDATEKQDSFCIKRGISRLPPDERNAAHGVFIEFARVNQSAVLLADDFEVFVRKRFFARIIHAAALILPPLRREHNIVLPFIGNLQGSRLTERARRHGNPVRRAV